MRRALSGPQAWLAAALLTASGCATTDAPVASSPAEAVAADVASGDTPAPREFAGPQAGAVAPSLAPLMWYRGAPPPAGRPYVLFFWGTWCKPCKAALPTLMKRCGERALPIVAVSRDRPAQLDAFFATWTAPFPDRVAIDVGRHPVHHAYEAWSVPRFVYVGADGRVERVVYGTRNLDAL